MKKFLKITNIFQINNSISVLIGLVTAVVISSGSTQASAQSSAENRGGKQITAHTNFGSLHLGYFINSDLIVKFGYQKSGLVLGSTNFPSKDAIVDLSIDKFLGNSFYLNGGLGRRALTYENNLPVSGTYLIGDSPGAQSVTYTDYGVRAGLGNRWQWENFTVGAQWIGVYAPVMDPTVDYNTSALQSNEWQTGEESKRDKLTQPSLLTALQLGFSF